jgi:hypothetical protein
VSIVYLYHAIHRIQQHHAHSVAAPSQTLGMLQWVASSSRCLQRLCRPWLVLLSCEYEGDNTDDVHQHCQLLFCCVHNIVCVV